MSIPFNFDELPLGLGSDLFRMPGYLPPGPGLGSDLTQGTLPAVANAAPAGPIATVPNLLDQQQTIYGETAGIYPQLQTKADAKGVYHPANWDANSADQLKTARAWMAGVRLVNRNVHQSVPDLSNGVERMVWNNAVDAAQAAQKLQLPPGVNHFYIRQDGSSAPQGPGSLWTNPKLVKSFGPFINTGGGKTPKGSKTYIDFYKADD